MSWAVYILLCDQKTYYIGFTDDFDTRISEHINGYSPYTKRFSDIKLVHLENFKYKSIAKNRERQLKGWSAAKKKALISGDKTKLVQLSKSRKPGDGPTVI